MEIEEFEKLVDEAMSELPDKFKAAIDNVGVVVEDWPSPQIAKGRLLLGLYQGVPKTIWGRHQALQLPDKITIYRLPILWISQGNPQEIKKLVKSTVEHEVAHHFGISDSRLSEINKR